jgi:hypothetical protein
MSVSAKDFAEFLYAHKPVWRCSFCDHDTPLLNVAEKDQVAELAIPLQAMGLIPSTSTHNFYSLSCARCGNTSFFHKSAVHRWLGTRNLTFSINSPS